jgi:hypothetical protein
MDNKKQELIEDLPLSADHLIYLVLIVSGKKPAAWLQYGSDVWREGDTPQYVAPQKRALIDSSLQKLGVAYKIESRATDAGLAQTSAGRRRYHELLDIFVAKDDAALQSLLSARKAKDWRGLGTALGYPATAVAAFLTDDKLPVDDLPLEVQLSETAQFIGFMLSKDHWKDELQQVEEWVKTIKQNSEIVYNAYLIRHGINRQLAEKILPRLTA